MREKLARKRAYQQVSIRDLGVHFPDLQVENQVARMIEEQGLKDGREEDTNRVIYHENFSYIPDIIGSELMSRHYDGSLASHFGIKKHRKLVA